MEMIGQSLYQFVHTNDLAALEGSHRSLLDKGQTVTKYYRLMRKEGGSIWLQSYATLVNNPRNMPKPQHIVGICIVLGQNQFDHSCIFNQPDMYKTATNAASTTLKAANNGLHKLRADKLGAGIKFPSSLTDPSKAKISTPCSTKTQRSYRRASQKHSAIRKTSQKSPALKVAPPSAADSKVVEVYGFPEDRSRFDYFNEQVNELNSGQTYCNGSCLYQLELEPRAIPYNCQAGVTIGSVRRPSDDTCSLVSSAASTSMSSSSSVIACCSSYQDSPLAPHLQNYATSTVTGQSYHSHVSNSTSSSPASPVAISTLYNSTPIATPILPAVVEKTNHDLHQPNSQTIMDSNKIPSIAGSDKSISSQHLQYPQYRTLVPVDEMMTASEPWEMPTDPAGLAREANVTGSMLVDEQVSSYPRPSYNLNTENNWNGFQPHQDWNMVRPSERNLSSGPQQYHLESSQPSTFFNNGSTTNFSDSFVSSQYTEPPPYLSNSHNISSTAVHRHQPVCVTRDGYTVTSI